MAMFPSLASIFGGNSAPQVPAAPVAQTSVTTAGANPTVPSATTPASNGSVLAIPAAQTGDASPLDKFQDLWKMDPNAAPVIPPSLVPQLNLDPAKLMENASKIDFVKALDPALVDQALSGDRAAFLQVLNSTMQFGFANSTMASAKMMEGSLSNAENILTKNVLPAAFRNRDVNQALAANNPIFSDPAVAPLMNLLQSQLQQKHPTASAEEIATTAAAYIGQMSNKFVTAQGGKIVQEAQRTSAGGYASPGEADWDTLLGIS